MKNKKTILATLALGLIAAPTILTANVYAADSNATVEFTAPTDSVDPVDPEDPSQPGDVDEDDGNITGETGPFTLDYVSHIDFGSHEISPSSQVYNSTTERPYIQVSDRRGTGEGWNVTASASTFNDGSDPSLPGSVISFADGDAISASTTDGPTVNGSIDLATGGDAVQVASAEARESGAALNTAEGLGTWVVRWLSEDTTDTNEKVSLNVPEASATEGNHTSTITWTLTSGPGQ
ncbi:WxL domain-containing protein [Corticicoccus populi]|uniref:WxL domain-containing protein n=1 Tax=Corticicoccus populi TaxID=1812821 RepID=A0ABW5WV97_9STAP